MASSVARSGRTTLLTGTLIVFLFFLFNFSSTHGQSDPPYVAVVRSPVATTTNPTIIEVYTGDSQTANVTFDKAVLPGGADSPGYMFTHNSPRVPDEAMTNTSSEPATLTLPTTMETAARTGIYTITVTEDESPAVAWRVLVTNEAATIKGLEYSTGASMGDNVTVMVESSVDTATLRWRRDGVNNPDGSTGSSCKGKTSCGDASASNSVVFESQKTREYSEQVHAIMNVIVRACPDNKWSPPDCKNTCEPCINGGVCSDLTGVCLCPPGFSGKNCENIHGRNVFGQNAEYKCDNSSDDHADGCQGAIICYPDPLGCFCPAGYKGLNCTEECETGKFGANCKQECHCADNTVCALDTGVCENQCEDGWRGTNCQYGPCPDGYYGDFCNLPCSCSGGEDACSEVEANCVNGCAVPWTGTACNQVPNPPGNVTVTVKAETSMTIEWGDLISSCSEVITYKLRYRPIEKLYEQQFVVPGFFPQVEIADNGENNVYQLTDLEPSTVYEIQLHAQTSAGQKEVFSITEKTNLFTGLEPPTVPSEILQDGTTATLILPALNQPYASSYYIRVQLTALTRQKRDVDGFKSFHQNPDEYIAAEVEKRVEDQMFTVGDGEMYGMYLNAPLREGESYDVFIGTGSKAGEDVAVVWSDPIPVVIPSPQDMPLAIIIVFPLVVIVILVVLVSVGVIIYKRRSLSKEPDGEYHPRLTVTNPVYSEDSESAISQPDEIVAIDDKSIKISDLATYVKQKKENRADNFFTEFETLPSNKLHPWTVAEKPENKTKNRYGNILPYDNSRVVLDKVNGDPHSDYINASYIDGYKAPKKFIASHGPNKDSVVDFWRMVWQENVSTIVMLTPLVEKKKKKCLKYWPDQEMIYGEFLVKCQKLEEHSKYDQRIFTVFLKHGGESRTVKHFHFTDWSDMKIPEFLDPILDFLEIVKNTSQKNVPNTIVHCSAGVGRTGTYITLDAMLDMAQAEGKVNVYKFVTEMRQRRFMSVQIQDQYQFIFDALVKHFCIGRTTMSVDSFRVELASLKDTNKKTNETFLTEQFKKLEETSTTPSSSDVSEAKKMENRSRNRFSTILPVEEHRPFLMTNVGENYNNYINASFLNGYKKRDFFIATQMPLKNTILDFWRLVWDYECSVIIMLNELDDKDEQYWPETSPVTFSPFTIAPLSSDVHGSICVRKMEVTNTARQSQNIRTVMQMQCLGWPNNETVANSPELLLHCVHQLSQWCKESAIDRVLVHCMDGVGRTGVFCGLVAALDQAQAVNEVDIFQLISNMRSAQPLMIQNLEQYQCIFDAVLIHLETRSSTYTNLPFRSEQSRREC